MAHGRNHDEREQKLKLTRGGNSPDADDFEAELRLAGRHGGMPKQHLVGAHTERYGGTTPETTVDEDDGEQREEPTGPGADVAPTAKAEARERRRHDLEEEIGRVTAGREGLVREEKRPDVTREELEQAARRADEEIVGHELTRR